MAVPKIDKDGLTWATRERPWLVPWNRKLRHLLSISLRNLELSPHSQRQRLRINDDDVLPSALTSPAKQLALREAKVLGHSRSSDSLRPRHELSKAGDKASVEASKDRKARPSKRMRRRSTLDWSSASSLLRQQTLEAVAEARLADVFYTLHVAGVEQPIYASEVVEQTMNPDFQRIDLSNSGSWVGREGKVTIKVWARRGSSERFKLLVENSLDLRSLHFIGRDLAAFNHPLPLNAMIFELRDGFYTCFVDAQVAEPVNPFASAHARPSSPRSVPSASFDALLRLSKLDDSIQDALHLRTKLASDLTAMMESQQEPLQNESRGKGSQDFLKTIQYANATVERQIRSLRQLRDKKKETLQRRRRMLSIGLVEHENGAELIRKECVEVTQTYEDLRTMSRAIINQRRRISVDLGHIYPLQPLPDKPLSFSIRNLHLPDSEDLDHTAPDVIAAALGYATHILQLATFYLDQALPYPCHPRSSTSSITDPISELKAAPSSSSTLNSPYARQHGKHTGSNEIAVLLDPLRTFPLFSRHSGPKYRFDYGLFLLNKNIQVLLANAYAVRVLDIRQTLPNLMYVLACMGAGEGELPARKAGGVRGLLRSGGGLGEHYDSRDSSPGQTLSPSTMNGIRVKREWQVQAEDHGLDKATSFKPGSGRGRKANGSGAGPPVIGEHDWEGILRGDPKSMKRGAAIAGAHTLAHDGKMGKE